MKNVFKVLRLLVLAGMIVLPKLIAAQPVVVDDVQDNPVPFDGGVSLLVAAAIGYGIKKAHNNKRANQV